MRAFEIARVNLVRMLRDRMGLFFVFLLPTVLIIVLGTVYGGRVAPRLGVVTVEAGPLGADLVQTIKEGDLELEIKQYASEAELRAAVEEGRLEIGLIVPPSYDTTLRSGGTATLRVLGRVESSLSALREAVDAAVAQQSGAVRAARLVVAQGLGAFDAGLAQAKASEPTLAKVTVEVTTVGSAIFPSGTTAFAPGAQSQLVLFMFLTSLTAAAQVVLTRHLGVSARMVSTPTPFRTILLGESLGRFFVAMLQGVFIVLLSSLAFGVSWGDPVAASAIVILFALVGTGAAMVIGVFAKNADQAGSLGVFLGMTLGALGGAMVPLEVFGEPMKTLAMLTPHAWAIQGLREVALRGSDITGITTELGVLALFAVVLLALGTWGFRRAIVR
jgi:ABC-2 type transport system permease protein